MIVGFGLTFAESLSQKAYARLVKMGVEIRTNARVERVDAEGVVVGGEHIASRMVLWTAGATLVAAHAAKMISELTLAMTHKVPLEVLAETVHCYPTQAEVFQRIALEYAKTRKTAATDEASGRMKR
jgi:NADH dehydrogenase FAD-containing subunit